MDPSVPSVSALGASSDINSYEQLTPRWKLNAIIHKMTVRSLERNNLSPLLVKTAERPQGVNIPKRLSFVLRFLKA